MEVLAVVVTLVSLTTADAWGTTVFSIYDELTRSSSSMEGAMYFPQDLIIIGNQITEAGEVLTGIPTAYLNWDSALASMQNFTSILEQLRLSGEMLTFLIAVEDPLPILKVLEKLGYQNSTKMLIVTNEEDTSKWNTLPPEVLNFNSDVYLISTTKSAEAERNMQIEEVYSFKNTTFHQRVEIEADKTALIEILRKAARRRNFGKLPVVGTIAVDAGRGNTVLYNVDVNTTSGEVKLISGFRIEEFFNLRDSLNFTGIGIMADGFANLGPDGKLTGIGKLVSENIADLTIPSSEMVPYRLNELSFLHPTSSQELSAYFKQLPATSLRDIYSQAFTKNLWIATITVWATFSAVVMIFIGICKYFCESDSDREADRFGAPFEYILLAIGLLCQQGAFRISARSPKALKVVLISGLLTSFVLYTAYCGSLVSTLSTPLFPIKSFRDIIRHKFNLYGETKTLAAESLIKQVQTNHTWLNGTRLNGGDNPMISTERAFPKILHSKSAFLVDPRTFHWVMDTINVTDHFICTHLSIVPTDRRAGRTGMAVKKGSPLREVFNHHILQMFERGIRHRIELRFKKSTTLNCLKTEQTRYKADLSSQDVGTATIILILGFVISLVFLCLEKLIGCGRNSSLKKRKLSGQ